MTGPVRLSLNGDDWVFKGFYGEDWRWRNAHRPGTRDVRHWHMGSVPGSVPHDLWRAGLIPDPYFELNTLQCEWVADRTWLYKKTFAVDETLKGRRASLRFEGVDYEAQFFLNGEALGAHRGMYTPTEFEVIERLRYGDDNLLVVVIERAPDEQPQVGYTSRVRTHKARMNYWWDFCPRLVHQGIWQGVSLMFTGPVRVEDVWVRPTLAAPWTAADVRVTASLSANSPAAADVTMTLRLAEQVVARHTERQALAAGSTTVTAEFHLPDPQLWWPNGQGDQPLYTAEVVVDVLEGLELAPSDARRVRFGVRHLEFMPNDGAPAEARPYVLVVNGRRTYINGWNWVPLDVLYGVPRPEKLARLLQLAARAHANVLRVWGGGLIETEAFYERCDELGLLVWQEFIQSSSGIDNDPTRDPDFMAEMTAEARQIVPGRRNHPCLAVWGGGNELQAGPETPANDDHPMLAALKAVVNELDPGRAWLPTSPTGPVFSNSLENLDRDPSQLHDVHGPWEHQGQVAQFTLYNRGSSLLHSEFGVEGLTNRKALDRVLRPEHQWPVTLDSALWQHLGAWWVKAPRWRELFGDLDNLATLHRALQWSQADGLRYAVEANRRRQFQNAGSLPWQFNEPYPMAACTSAVDYFAEPKPVYYAVARAYAPLTVSARFDRQAWAGDTAFSAEVWASNALKVPFSGVALTAQLMGLDGSTHTTHTATVDIGANGSMRLSGLEADLSDMAGDVFLLDLALSDEAGKRLTANRYLFSRTANLAPLLHPPATTLDVSAERKAGQVNVINRGPAVAVEVWLEPDRTVEAEGFAYFSDNYFCLLPGETRGVSIEWTHVPPTEQRLRVSAWNAPEQLR